MAKKLTVEQDAELTVEQRWELLSILKHERMSHVKEIYILDAGVKGCKWSFSQGTELRVKEALDPEKAADAKVITLSGKRFRYVTLPGKYVNRMRVIDTIDVEDFLAEEDDIKSAYTEFLAEDRAKRKKAMLDNPDATAELLAEMMKKATKGADKQKAAADTQE